MPKDLLKAGLIVLALLSPFLIYLGTVQSIVAIWDRSDTFMHQYCILPISLWLIWRRRETLAQMTPQPYWPALALLALCGFAWLLGSLADVLVVKQFAFAAIVILTAVALLGRRISWKIAFPLLFLLLAIPFGEVFIDPLIQFTADFTIAALRATGIPVWREGNSFYIPSGHWSVVEACSGVRYLIASFTLGLLYAYLTYRSRLRQAAFVLVSIIVPIIANGLRAYMIVMIGHLSGMRLAVGVDHIIYGWLFFGLVMFLMFWIGNFWHEGKQTKPATVDTVAAIPAMQPVSTGRFIAAVTCIVACIAIWPIYAKTMQRANVNAAPVNLTFRSDWAVTAPFTDWQPAFYRPDTQLDRFFQNKDRQAGLSIYFYRNQHPGSTLISSANRTLPEKHSQWVQLNAETRTEALDGGALAVREETIKSPSGALLIWHWYWIDGQFTANDYIGKMLQAKQALAMHGDDGAHLVAFAPYKDNPEEARQALRAFLSANLTPIEAALAGNGKP
jgi:exosortase A